MKTHDCKQGSSEWSQLRLGRPTASDFDQLVTPEWKIRTGQMPETYLYQKLCERILGYSPRDAVGTFEMGQGIILESEARPWYEFTRDVRVQTPGFCTTDDGRIGCSPDGLIGEDGGLEVKCPQPERALRYLLDGGVPKEYLPQVHGSMLVTGRPWWDFLSYSRQFPALVVRVERDERIQAVLADALGAFLYKFDSKLATITAMRDAENAKREAQPEDRSR
jgi:hypothetical protein